ncbi:MAG: hypothetical protein Sapg2KO_35940 [Saprospiraceae bacterium]
MVFGLTYLDLIVMTLYFGVIIYIGVRASFGVKSQEDYLLGGRKFGKLTSTFASFGQATSADGPAGVATTTFNNGAAGIWSSLLMLFVTPLFWITAPWLRRMRVLTMGDFYKERYGSNKMAATYALIASIGMMGLLSVGYMAVAKTATAMTPKPLTELTSSETIEFNQAAALKRLEASDISQFNAADLEELDQLRKANPRSIFSYLNETMLIWGICFIVLLYTLLGGLEAAVYTDLLQGVFIIILSIILLPFAWSSINELYGGNGILTALTHLHQQLPEDSFEIFGAPQTIDFTWYFILTAALVSGLTVVTQPNQLVTAGAAKDEYSARIGFVTGTFMKRIVTILWGMLGLAAILLFSKEINNPDLTWGHATRALLGPLNMGLIGLMLASMMAALMSTADCLMLTVSGLVVNNLYKPFADNPSEKKLILVGRISGAIFLIGGAIITTQFDNILQILKFIWEFFVVFAAAFWLGLKWRKANRKGAWISIVGSFSLFYLIPIILPLLFPQMRTKASLVKQTNPPTMEREYTARPMDVTKRNKAITEWNQAAQNNNPVGTQPQVLKEGDLFKKAYQLPKKSIYWSKGISTTPNNTLQGNGYIYLELWLLDAIGFDLSKNPYALNESIRLLIRLIFPFILLISGSLLFKVNQEALLRPFYTKMRIPVSQQGKAHDKELLQAGLTYFNNAAPILLFPNSNWEFYKWNRQDSLGFILAWLMVLGVLLLLYLAVTLGS